MPAAPPAELPKTWSSLDFGLHAFLVINPLALGLWAFSLAPFIGGNLFGLGVERFGRVVRRLGALALC